MYQHRHGARAEYQHEEGQRVKDSPSIASKFGKLKSLMVNLTYHNPDGVTKSSEVKYEVNLANAKSVFRFKCPNPECVGGDFDLSDELSDAVDARRTTVTGELTCQGWLNRATIGSAHCSNILRYKLTLKY
ncbi:MAG TPA: hypothetical protein VL486_10570 [Verrucomicrobiae bacterium]|nr:hypothetical protein [Verrucomicrobiae bacterium]